VFGLNLGQGPVLPGRVAQENIAAVSGLKRTGRDSVAPVKAPLMLPNTLAMAPDPPIGPEIAAAADPGAEIRRRCPLSSARLQRRSKA